MKLPLIILVLSVIIFLAYIISSKLLKRKDGYEIDVKPTPEINTKHEEEIPDRTVMTGTFKGTRNKVRGPKNSESDKKTDTEKINKKKEPTKKGEKRKYSPRKKKDDKGDDLLLS